MKIFYILLLSLLVGCAQAPPISNHQSKYEINMSTDIGVILEIQSVEGETFLGLNISNPKELLLEAWLDHRHKTNTREASTFSLVYRGSSKTANSLFRVPKSEHNVTELFRLVIKDSDGMVLFETDPIVNRRDGT